MFTKYPYASRSLSQNGPSESSLFRGRLPSDALGTLHASSAEARGPSGTGTASATQRAAVHVSSHQALALWLGTGRGAAFVASHQSAHAQIAMCPLSAVSLFHEHGLPLSGRHA